MIIAYCNDCSMQFTAGSIKETRPPLTHEQVEEIADASFDWIMIPIGAIADAFFGLFDGRRRTTPEPITSRRRASPATTDARRARR